MYRDDSWGIKSRTEAQAEQLRAEGVVNRQQRDLHGFAAGLFLSGAVGSFVAGEIAVGLLSTLAAIFEGVHALLVASGAARARCIWCNDRNLEAP